MAHRQFTEIDFSSVTAGKKIQNKSGKGHTVKLSGSSGSTISGKTPFLLCRFGINTEEVAARDGLEGYSKRSLRPSLDGYSENEQLGQFVNSVKQMDNTIIDIAIKNPQWFGVKVHNGVGEGPQWCVGVQPQDKNAHRPDRTGDAGSNSPSPDAALSGGCSSLR